jgi:cellulose synthase/poly-beta-1,6-N-acetylglucosamine synthase-like glycosyltransferase
MFLSLGIHGTVFLVFSFLYFTVIILVMIGLNRLRRFPADAGQTPTVSVVIAARNEARRIRTCLQSLEQLEYPEDKYEVILVDDASTDETSTIIQSYAKRHRNWQLICLEKKDSALRGKKKALKSAIAVANGELIFTTDADCRVPPAWLKVMTAYFDEKTAMALGHSPLRTGGGFFNILLKFDNLFSAISSSAPTMMGFPISSVGRNMAYRKSAYEKVGGFDVLQRFKSGDDVHMTERFRQAGVGRITYCAHPESFVETLPHASFNEVMQQQIRKNSKTFTQSNAVILFSIVLFIACILFFLIPFIDSGLLGLWLWVIIVKFLLEFLALSLAVIVFRKKALWPWLPLIQIVYPFYILLFEFVGVLQIYQWKK